MSRTGTVMRPAVSYDTNLHGIADLVLIQNSEKIICITDFRSIEGNDDVAQAPLHHSLFASVRADQHLQQLVREQLARRAHHPATGSSS